MEVNFDGDNDLGGEEIGGDGDVDDGEEGNDGNVSGESWWGRMEFAVVMGREVVMEIFDEIGRGGEDGGGWRRLEEMGGAREVARPWGGSSEVRGNHIYSNIALIR